MSIPLRSPGPGALLRGPSGAPRGVRRVAAPLVAAVCVLGFWYGTTGALLALERSAETRAAALVVAIVAGVAGLACTRVARRDSGAWSGGLAVLGGALLWTTVAAAFYGGWVVGPADGRPVAAGPAPSVARALAAMGATAYSTLLAAVLLAAACRVAWARAPRGGTADPAHGPRLTLARPVATLAPLTFATLWAAHELAKLNVFLGVASPGGSYLPPYLGHLRAFFGPTHNSPLLGWSVAALAIAAGVAGYRARTAAEPGRRTGLALVAGVLVLAAFEHALLGVTAPPHWWDAFLAWRGGAGA